MWPLEHNSKICFAGLTKKFRLGFRVPDLHRVAIKIICKRTIVTTFKKICHRDLKAENEQLRQVQIDVSK